MQEELRRLMRDERPKVVEVVAWAAGNGDRSENGDYIYGKKRLREIDSRIRFLTKRLESAEIVDPHRQKNRDQVFFGATVTYADRDGTEKTITIVGIDEASRSAIGTTHSAESHQTECRRDPEATGSAKHKAGYAATAVPPTASIASGTAMSLDAKTG